MNRRDFLVLSSGSLIAATTGPAAPTDAQAGAATPWYETMRRCGQLNLNERDPLTLNVAEWIDYWASLKLDALLLNGGGIVAFYPTAVPYHHRSEFLGTRDLFGELAAATKARGMRLVARMDCNYPAFPPEMVFPRTPKTDQPAALFRETGRSRVAYFAGDVDRTFWRSGNPDLGLLMQNTVKWLRGPDRAPVSLEGDGVVEAFAWETEPGYALHILNYTNPNMTRGFIRKFYAIGSQKAQFRVASGRRIKTVRALRASRSLSFTQDGDLVRFDVPSVTDYEVVALT